LKILLAPAEIKLVGGTQKSFCKSNFSFPTIFDKRLEVFENYEQFIQNSSLDELSKWFGIKKSNDVFKYSKSLKDKPSMKAIRRYTGVAFEALDYNSLNIKAQDYIDKNVLIFSNLFGVCKAKDFVPD